uniref:Uncharacterized protein n=1 Tax=Oryza nivara TaxID=4536 RepID=A0A0E0GSZ4_ORYNI
MVGFPGAVSASSPETEEGERGAGAPPAPANGPAWTIGVGDLWAEWTARMGCGPFAAKFKAQYGAATALVGECNAECNIKPLHLKEPVCYTGEKETYKIQGTKGMKIEKRGHGPINFDSFMMQRLRNEMRHHTLD